MERGVDGEKKTRERNYVFSSKKKKEEEHE